MEIQNGKLISVYNEEINADGSFDFPEGVQSIGIRAFAVRTNLSRIELPEGLQFIGKFAFSDCTSLSRIELPEGLQFIGRFAFWGCTSLNHIELPAGLQHIGIRAFDKCPSLSHIVIPSHNEEEYQRIKALLPEHLQAVADRTREEIRVRDAISVLGQASGSGFFATETENAPELPTDIVLHQVCQQLVNTSGLANFFPPQQTRAIFERAQNAEREPTP